MGESYRRRLDLWNGHLYSMYAYQRYVKTTLVKKLTGTIQGLATIKFHDSIILSELFLHLVV